MCSSPGLLSDDIFEREETVGRSFIDRSFIERRRRRIGCAATANTTIVTSVILQSAKAYSHTVRTIIAERCRSFLDTSGGTETILRMKSTEGYSVGSWWRSPVRTTCVPLDHGGPTIVLGGGMRISASGARRRRAPRSARSSGNRRERHLTREHVTLADVLAG